MNTESFLQKALLTRAMVDRFLDPDAHNWAKFDAELGYLIRDGVVRDGIDNSYTIGHYDSARARRQINYANLPCRVNTYGDSFTQCHQVSDGETWQEVLAAHLGEPIRNYGVGGFGVYQAYRRLLREEATDAATENVVLNIWIYDHRRSLFSWRWLHITSFRTDLYNMNIDPNQAWMFHATPSDYLVFDTVSGTFRERPSICPTPESLYNLCNLDFVKEVFTDCFDVQVLLAIEGVDDMKLEMLQQIADALNVLVDFSEPNAIKASAETLLWACALRSTMWILDQLQRYVEQQGKKLLVLLSYGETEVLNACRGVARIDQPIVDYLTTYNIAFVDTLAAHMQDYAQFSCTPQDYVKRYYIGHYNPLGNHFFAFAIKDALVDWLDPRPPTYRTDGPTQQRLAGHLA